MTREMNVLIQDLIEILGTVEYADGLATVATLDVERLERSLHGVVPGYRPSRPDSSVHPCPHNCNWCCDNDIPSGNVPGTLRV
jgi:hypothetical protein